MKKEDKNFMLEKYEWDNLWWEQTGDDRTPRVLYIGDSISDGVRRHVQGIAENKVLFDRFGTSKALDNPFFADSLRSFCKQQGRRELIVFNNGLHGFHLSDVEEYGRYYDAFVRFLLEEYEGTPLVLALTTKVVGATDERVIVRNETVKKIAAKYNLSIIDLYQISEECFELISNDGIHFSEEGYERIAVKFWEEVIPLLGCV